MKPFLPGLAASVVTSFGSDRVYPGFSFHYSFVGACPGRRTPTTSRGFLIPYFGAKFGGVFFQKVLEDRSDSRTRSQPTAGGPARFFYQA